MLMAAATGTLSIDLAAVRSNWLMVRQALGKSPAAVIKADAYGLGAKVLGNTLYRQGCRDFFFATLPEAQAARSYLPHDSNLFILGGIPYGAERECINGRLIPVLSSVQAIERWGAICDEADVVSPSAVKIDTGMTRLGISLEEWVALMERPGLLQACHPAMFMSHLACADEADHPMNREQLARFTGVARAAKARFPRSRCSLANSAGIFLGSDWHFDLARPGACLYGFDPHWGQQPHMAPVVTLELPILQIRELTQSSSVGYGATACLPAGRRLAVAAGGYADGLNRTIGREGGYGYLGGQRVPVVGRISMDTTVFDITGAELPIRGPAKIQVLGASLTVAEISHRTGALGYEVLTSLAGRYEREYLNRDG